MRYASIVPSKIITDVVKKELNLRLKGKPINEIILFREIHSILNTKFNSILIEEAHQHKISYKSKALNNFIKREISDLLIITFSIKMKKAKMTFLQAKYKREKTLNGKEFSFKGDFFQYELLATRPTITNHSAKFNFPSNILSFSNFDSIGSFGVFYNDTKGRLDMAYAVAKDLSVKKKVTSKKQSSRTLYFPKLSQNSFTIKVNNNIPVELRASQTINCFTTGLLHMLIGGEFINQKSIVQFLINYFNSRPKTETISQQFLSYLNDNNDLGVSEVGEVGEFTGLGNVLLINIDGTNS